MHIKRKLIIMAEIFAVFSMYMVSGQWVRTASMKLPDNNVQVVNGRSGQIYSPYAVLINADTGEILMDTGGEERMYPASLTKIMTAIVAVEHTEDLDERVVLDKDIFEDLHGTDASMAGFQPGEEVTLKDLLYGILLPVCVGNGSRFCRFNESESRRTWYGTYPFFKCHRTSFGKSLYDGGGYGNPVKICSVESDFQRSFYKSDL